VYPVAGIVSALSLFTILPLPARPLDRRTAGATMLAAPIAGLFTASVAEGVLLGLRWVIEKDELHFVLMAIVGIAAVAITSRGLHLDGLADTADALGSYRDAPSALEIMSKGDVGPFGVTTIVMTLLLQTGALHACLQVHRSTVGLVVAGMTGMLAATWGAVAVPAARASGLGALVARSVRGWQAATATALVVLVAAYAGSVDERAGAHGAWRAVAAVFVGLLLAWVFRRHAVRRLGGITGDVYGALIEIGLTSSLIAVAIIR
jgi:adenosylcobinamide-GDP ribazoletransferase